MFKRISIFPALFLVAIAALISGCGGGDDTVTRAEFIKEAEAICKKSESVEAQLQGKFTQENYERLKREPPPPNNSRSITEIVRTIRMPAVMKELEELKALEMPEGDEKKLETIYTGTEAGLKKLGEEPQLIWASRAGNPLFPSFKEARDYGFQSCAES